MPAKVVMSLFTFLLSAVFALPATFSDRLAALEQQVKLHKHETAQGTLPCFNMQSLRLCHRLPQSHHLYNLLAERLFIYTTNRI